MFPRPLGYGQVAFGDPVRDGDEYDEKQGFARGSIVETDQFVRVTDDEGITIHIPAHSVDAMVTAKDKATFESYLMHAELSQHDTD
ncbi:hypothetical protein [Corynebacterium heidelbergense]|uniref:Uncharacterized protein n=1 Tax=Corynebacterium heidelbergense TaxID=2055947 RepID=A0A364VE70_9CORY|nr:hypothetical protein [Corynebacterium heidelbergense]RAV34904.1 hypothetical protein CWC39_00770 [Corynebacterium heidelbergense]WCZ36040.1 hypothetical protein CHEID_02365 [Corynebacterium heidelbergense]